MCGIVGIISKKQEGISWGNIELFNEMLVCDSIRGDDSTGIFTVLKSFNCSYAKIASNPFVLFKTKEYLAWKQEAWSNGRVVVGHNRKATAGAVNNDNAHPFTFGPIALVHNGYIENYKTLVHWRERDKQKIEVDSHVVAALLAREEPEKVLPELRGAFALVWYNTSTKTLHFIRNEERPLSILENDDGIFFASEGGMLRWLGARRGLKGNIADLKPGAYLTYNVEEKEWTTKTVDVFKRAPIVVHQRAQAPLPPALPAPAKVIPLPQSTFSTTPEKDRYNIHYGNDKIIETDRVTYPQIIFSCDDYRRVSEDHVYLPVWKLWGPALDSDNIEVHAQFRGTEADAEELAYKDFICAKISRVMERKILDKTVTLVYCTEPRAVDMTVTPNNRLRITKDHLEYIKQKTKCACDAIDVSTLENDSDIYIRDGFTTKASCVWCVEGTPACTKFCTEPGKCEYCKTEAQKKEDEKTNNPAVQAGK